MKRRFSLVVCVLLVLGVLCGSAWAATSAAAPKYKKEIIYATLGKIITIDPHAQSNTEHNYVFRTVFDTLLHYDWTTAKINPRLATSWATDDAKTYTLKLRDDAYFHNGEQVKASDVAFTFKRAVGTNSANVIGVLIENMDIVNDFEIKITLKRPNVDFPYLLCNPNASIMSEKAVKDDPVEGPGVGSGVWKIDSYEFGDYFRLVRNDKYWGDKALAEVLTIRYIPDATGRLIALETDEIDVCQNPDPLNVKKISETPGLEIQSWDASTMTYIAMNMSKPPFDNKDLRMAIAHAVNRKEFIDVGRNGYAKEAFNFWGWSQYGYNGGTTSYEYNLDLAKEYLAKAYPRGGAKFEITVAPDRKLIAELLQARLKEIGIEVTIAETDYAGLTSTLTSGRHQATAYGVGLNPWGDTIRNMICPGGANSAFINDPRINTLMDNAVTELDDAKRKAMYAEIQQILYEEAPYVPLYYATGFLAVRKGISGIEFHMGSMHNLSYIHMIEQ